MIEEIREYAALTVEVLGELSGDIDAAQEALFARLESLCEAANGIAVQGAARSGALMDAYLAAGFSREEAMMLMLNAKAALKRVLDESGKKRGGKS